MSRDETANAVTLAPFEAHRVDELVAMWRASFEHGVGVVEPHTVADQRRYFLDVVLAQHAVHTAVQPDGRLVGFIAASDTRVDQLYVHVGHLRRGIGVQLLDWAKAQSTGTLQLYTFARNQAARAFYARQGFAEVAQGFEPTLQLDDVLLAWHAGGRTP